MEMDRRTQRERVNVIARVRNYDRIERMKEREREREMNENKWEEEEENDRFSSSDLLTIPIEGIKRLE